MTNQHGGPRASKARTPLAPDPDAIERQYGEDAELYAEVRADTAAALGRHDAVRQWEEAQADIERESAGEPSD